MFHLFQTYVASVLSICFICCNGYTRMLQVFYLDVAYVAVAIHICCKRLFKKFHLFQTYVASVYLGYYICCSGYTHMLQVYVPNVLPFSYVCCSRCCSPRALSHGHARAAAPIQRYLSLSCEPALTVGRARNGRLVPKHASTPWSKCMHACRVPERASTQRT